jgi:hypothetical protein
MKSDDRPGSPLLGKQLKVQHPACTRCHSICSNDICVWVTFTAEYTCVVTRSERRRSALWLEATSHVVDKQLHAAGGTRVVDKQLHAYLCCFVDGCKRGLPAPAAPAASSRRRYAEPAETSTND